MSDILWWYWIILASGFIVTELVFMAWACVLFANWVVGLIPAVARVREAERLRQWSEIDGEIARLVARGAFEE